MVEETAPPRIAGESMQAPPEQVPWYSLHPRHLHFNKWTWRLLVVAFVFYFFYAFSVKPLWNSAGARISIARNNFSRKNPPRANRSAAATGSPRGKSSSTARPVCNDKLVREAAEGHEKCR